jgi:hypothetical protein
MNRSEIPCVVNEGSTGGLLSPQRVYSASGERRFVDIHLAMPLDLWSRRNRGLVIRVCARAKVQVPRKYVCVYVYVCMYACMYPV